MKYLLCAFALFFFYSTFAQSFKIGSIDIYGNRKTDPVTIRSHLGLKENDSISVENFKSKKEGIITALMQIPGVKHADVNAVCCYPNGDLMLYTGIGETDSVIIKFREAPSQNIRLADEMMKSYQALDSLTGVAAQTGDASEDDSQGYSLFNYVPARNEQKKFIGYASKYFPLLANVLKNSASALHRAAAAEIIPYAADKKKVAAYLLYAANDAHEDVRNNATRAIAILANYSESHPQLKIHIPATLFIRMMNSIVWSDRNKGAFTLLRLTQNRSPEILSEIKKNALPCVIEMARWKDRSHAFYSFIILGRIAGVEEKLLIDKNNSPGYMAEVDSMLSKCCQ